MLSLPAATSAQRPYLRRRGDGRDHQPQRLQGHAGAVREPGRTGEACQRNKLPGVLWALRAAGKRAGRSVSPKDRMCGSGASLLVNDQLPSLLPTTLAQIRLWFDSPGNPLVAEPHFPHAQGQASGQRSFLGLDSCNKARSLAAMRSPKPSRMCGSAMPVTVSTACNACCASLQSAKAPAHGQHNAGGGLRSRADPVHADGRPLEVYVKLLHCTS